nr:hypothetical protein [Tanacetum cinerariifolium]
MPYTIARAICMHDMICFYLVMEVPQDYDVSSAIPCLFIHVIYAISLSLYPFTERYAQPYFFSCLIRQGIREGHYKEPSMVSEDEETSKDKEIDKLMALISLSFKKIYKPTNNNLQTSSNTSHANQDISPRINRNAGYENQRNGNVAGARETVGSSVVHKYGIQCFNCKEFRHVARECQKPKRAKDAAYHREKMLLCKQEEAGIQLNAEQAD